MKNRTMYKTALLFGITALILVGCSSQTQNTTDENQTTSVGVQETESNTGKIENEDIKIATPYGNFSIPYGYEEIVTWENKDENDINKFCFYAVLEEKKIPVYDMEFSKEDIDGDTLLGSINHESEEVRVYFHPYDEVVSDEMSEDDKNVVYTAQETVNDVITSLNSFSDYVSNAN